MLVIAVDTSGQKGSIALCRGDGKSFDVLQITSLEGGTYSAQLMPRITELLRHNNFTRVMWTALWSSPAPARLRDCA